MTELYELVLQRNLIALYQKSANELVSAWNSILELSKDPAVAANIHDQTKRLVRILEIIGGNSWKDYSLQKTPIIEITKDYVALKEFLKGTPESNPFLEQIKKAISVFANTVLGKSSKKLESLKTDTNPDLKEYYQTVF